MRVEQFLKDSAFRFPEKIAVIAGGRRLSYGEADRASENFARTLVARGVTRGDRVGIFMDNCWEAVVSIFAVLKAGTVFVPLNPSLKPEKLAYILNNCRAAALVTAEKTIATAEMALAGAPHVAFTIVADESAFSTPDAQSALPLLADGIDLDLAMLIYTSGSTGFAKGVMMTHQNVVAAATSIITYLENTAEDVIINVLPISFDYGLYQILMAFKTGATLVLEKSFAFPQAILQRMKDEQVTGLPLVPTMAAMLLQMKDVKPGDLPNLRYITNTAAALPPAHIVRLQELFPRARLYSMYGLTECKRCTYLPPEELQRRPASVGKAIPGTEAYVVDEHGKRAPPGVTGELVIRGAHVMKGYWGDHAATANALREGPHPWEKVLYTGDLFRTDEDGFLYFVGRTDDIIKSRGEKVSPKEVEGVLYALPAIREAAVVGVPDPILGEAIKAIVVMDKEAKLSARDIIRHCAVYLEDFMVPKHVVFCDALPKTESGKISRRLAAACKAESAA
jgi:long-chain acyl-CoA synthetase